MRLRDFKALTFDCYGTLIDWEAGILAAFGPWRKRTGIAADDNRLLELFAEVESRIQRETPAMLYPEALALGLSRMGEKLSAPATEAEARAFGQSVKDWPAFPDSAEALRYLKDHYKLAILSNIDRASFAESARKLGVVFDAVVTAQDVGSYKPALRHFEAGLAKLAAMGVPKEKVLHTAQSLFHDHVPAKKLGLATMWINRRAGKSGGGATMKPAESVKPDAEVPSMAAFVEMHRREGAA
jgi:2-haloalkanoic acid dehalogenase type II